MNDLPHRILGLVRQAHDRVREAPSGADSLKALRGVVSDMATAAQMGAHEALRKPPALRGVHRDPPPVASLPVTLR